MMSRDKSLWFAEEVLLDTALINNKLECRDLQHLATLLRDEARLNRDPETGRLRPKKASEYTLRFIAQILHFMRRDLTQRPGNDADVLAVAEQCLRLIRSCAAFGMKIQTYICKDLRTLDDMLAIFNEYQNPTVEMNEESLKRFDPCMVALTQTLGNLVVNNPYNQTIIWDKFGANILNALIGQNEKIASCCAMIVYNILLGQPNVLPDDVMLLNALAYMYSYGNTEFPHLIIEYLIGVENIYIEKLYNRLEPDTKLLILNLAYNILMSVETQDINVSVNFIKFIAHEFKVKSDCVLKTVDKYINSIEPQEVVFLMDIIGIASSMDAYMDCLQSDVSLFINCAFLLRSIHKLGKQENNFFSSIHKLYDKAGMSFPINASEKSASDSADQQNNIDKENTESVKKCDSTDMLQCNETVSECTESESSEQYFECTDQFNYNENYDTVASTINTEVKIPDSATIDTMNVPMNNITNPSYIKQGNTDRKVSDACRIDENFTKVTFAKNAKIDTIDSRLQNYNQSNIPKTEPPERSNSDQKTEITDDMEPPLITDSPEEVNQFEQRHNALGRKISMDVNITNMRKDSSSVQTIINTVILNKEPIQPIISRQQSVEPGIEASENVLKEMTSGIQQQFIPPIQKVVEIQPVETQNPQQNVEVIQPKPVQEPVPAKKNQTISSEFDLSEQLQKILGISTDKAVRSESVDASKEIHNVQPNVPKVEPTPVLSQSLPATTTTVSVGVENNSQLPKTQMNIPNVKIDSPESVHKNKIGNFEHTGPKKLTSIVESVEQHVAFGVKATLIKILGNLCWKNQPNKRQIRELDVIQVLLDCCNIDARNPLIMQWVILAIRNLCENCPENQAVISSMTLQEPVDNEILNEMGLTLHADPQNNTIKLVPLTKK